MMKDLWIGWNCKHCDVFIFLSCCGRFVTEAGDMMQGLGCTNSALCLYVEELTTLILPLSVVIFKSFGASKLTVNIIRAFFAIVITHL